MSKDRLLSDEELKSELHSIIIQAVTEEQSLDKSDVMVYPREQQKIYMKYRNKSFDLLNTQKYLYAESVIGEDERAKQAHTSLIKELVAEAKPESQSWDGLEPVVQIALSARRKAIDEFEQNLLKELEEL